MNEKGAIRNRWKGASASAFGKNVLGKEKMRALSSHTVASRRFLLLAVTILSGLAAVVYVALSATAWDKKNLEWPFYGHDLANTRFQNADEINTSNASKLRVAWVFHTGVLDPNAELEVSPIEVGGRLFITDGHDDVFALDATTGEQKWAYKPTQIPGEMPPLDKLFVCCGLNNRGVAFVPGSSRDDNDRDDAEASSASSASSDERKEKPDMVVYGRLDDVVVALNAQTGAVIWKTRVVDFHTRAAIDLAPQFAHGLVIVGLAGGEFEIRGQVIALKADSGEIAWRFQTTLPGSFAGDSFKRGGAPVWETPTVDEQLGLLYFATGNPAPDINGIDRAGDNLFSASVVALDLENGKPRWHFQETHHDLWDYDSAQPTMLFSVEKNGHQIPALGHCSKNGNYYILDRRNGQPIFPVTEVKVPVSPSFQNASPTQPLSSVEPLTPMNFLPGTIDMAKLPKNLTLEPQYTPPQENNILVPVGDEGGCEGMDAAAFSPRTKFIYYGTRYEPTTFQTSPTNTGPEAGSFFLGSTVTEVIPGVTSFGIFGATNSTTGKVVWKIDFAQPANSGILVAGDLAFFGEGNGKFHAVDAATGKILFTFDGTTVHNGGGAQGSPVAYVVKGKEFIVNDFGGSANDRQFAPNPVGDAVIAFSLP
jgi:quinohemoprotein ethanol dehydrogenase